MLRIYDVILDIIRAVKPLLEEIERHDADLARQIRRALSSVGLNTAEGSNSRGRNRGARYHSAAGSMSETLAGFQMAVAWGYLPGLNGELQNEMQHVVAVLLKNARC